MTLGYKTIIEIDNKKLTKEYIASLNREERESLAIAMFNYFRELGFRYPDLEIESFHKEYGNLKNYCFDVDNDEIYNNSSLATNICQYFCRYHLFGTTERKRGKLNKTFLENFNDDKLLKSLCRNRLGLGWYDEEPSSTFNITPKMVLYQGLRSMRLVPMTSFFKPSIAKAIYMKYSEEGDVVYDYASGFGARALGALSCGRKYIGVDPLTSNEIIDMLKFLDIPADQYKVYKTGSENYIGDEDSIDFAFSSPPYYDQEYYSSDITQAYNQGEDYFYNTYWLNTLQNCKKMLKADKLFALNILEKYSRMIDMAKNEFGDVVDIFYLRTVRSHLNKTGKLDSQKYEPVYIFKNNK